MSTSLATASLRDLFEFPFQGANGRNHFILGSIFILAGFWVPLLPLIFVYGYTVLIMRQVIEGEALELPAWENWGGLGKDGLRMLVIWFVYLFPGALIFFGGFLLYFVVTLVPPFTLGPALETPRGGAIFTVVFLGGLGILFISLFLGTLLILLGSMLLPVATAHFVAQDKLSAAFRFGEWWPLLKANKLGYFIAWVVVLGLITLLYLVFTLAYYTLVLLCFLPFLVAPLSFYLMLIASALFGQTYRESRGMVGV